MSTPSSPAQSENTPADGSAGARQLLDREAPADYVREWSERIARPEETEKPDTRSALVFRIGQEWLALPPAIFQEVARNCPAHSLPHRADGVVLGVVSVRGGLFVCVSLATVLGIGGQAAAPAGPRREYGRVLVISRGGTGLAFPVDEVHGVIRYHPEDLLPLPATLTENAARHTLGLVPWQGRTVGCLDDELLIYTLNRSLA